MVITNTCLCLRYTYTKAQEHASVFIWLSFSMVYSINLSRRILLHKVKVSLCFINYTIYHEDIRGSGGIAPPFFTSALDEVQSQLHTLDALSPGKKPPVTTEQETLWTLQPAWTLWRRKNCAPAKNQTPAIQPIPILTELSWLCFTE
jgi:hypothetical protein